jgi:hypothetical protein
MKTCISAIVAFAGMGMWWTFARDSGFSQVVEVLGLLAVGVVVPFIVERLLPR